MAKDAATAAGAGPLPRRRGRRSVAGAAALWTASAILAGGTLAQDSGEVAYKIEDYAILAPLTDQPGDPVRGKRVVTDASNATCLICHPMPIPEQPDHGNLGPDLAGVGSRYTAAELRLRIVDPKVLNPDTIMPAYYRKDGFLRVQEAYRNATVYSAQDVEDAVAYLLTLTEE